jgi:hypothetical protein
VTGPGFDPEQLEQHEASDPVAEQLERYAQATRTAPSSGLTDRIMTAVAHERPPRRSLGVWLAALPSGRVPGHRLARAGVLAAGVVLVVGGAFAFGELGRIINNASVGNTPSPAIETTVPTPSPTESPTESQLSNPPQTTPSEPESGSSSASETADATSSNGGTPTPRASKGEDGHTGSGTPEPTETPRATGSGGGDN